jgi:hypothetical protein
LEKLAVEGNFMNVATVNISAQEAMKALREYKQHRGSYDKHDWEIERIYRAISRGKKLINAREAVLQGGVDLQGRPKLAFAKADTVTVQCYLDSQGCRFSNPVSSSRWTFNVPGNWGPWQRLQAAVPRIPPQHRPPVKSLASYDILWEADWKALPRDPYLLKRMAPNAWLVVAAWELTDVEILVMSTPARH